MRVIETSLDEDLSTFSGWLWQQRVRHRVYEERGAQILEVADATQAGPVGEAYRAWKAGHLRIEAVPRQSTGTQAPRAAWLRALARYPGLTMLIALALLVFPFSRALATGELTAVAAWLTILDPRLFDDTLPSLPELVAQGQVWRWFTPVLLHFSVLHLAFNCAVVIELGRRVEAGLGTAGLWLVVVFLGVVSNLIQYGFGSGPMFGGLSGVAYGLLGLVVTLNRLRPAAPVWRLPPGLTLGLLVFLVIFTTGITEPFGLFVANAAHWAGLGAGIAAGLILRARRSA